MGGHRSCFAFSSLGAWGSNKNGKTCFSCLLSNEPQLTVVLFYRNITSGVIHGLHRDWQIKCRGGCTVIGEQLLGIRMKKVPALLWDDLWSTSSHGFQPNLCCTLRRWCFTSREGTFQRLGGLVSSTFFWYWSQCCVKHYTGSKFMVQITLQ